MASLTVAGTASGDVIRSADGIAWTKYGVSVFSNAVAYGNGLWVSVGQSGLVKTSVDGITWTTRTSGVSDDLQGVAFANGLWVAVGSNGTLITSPNGVTWTNRSPGSTAILLDVTYGAGRWLAVGTNPSFTTCLAFGSADGITWANLSIPAYAGFLSRVVYAAGRFVAVADGASGIYTSTTGLSLGPVSSPPASAGRHGLVWTGSQFVASDSNGSGMATSPDGLVWTAQSPGPGITNTRLGWDGARLLAGGDSGTLKTSPLSPLAWTARSSFTTARITSFASLTNVPPNAPAWTTAGGQTVDVAADSVLAWTFSDPDPGDSQSQFVLDRWALDGAGARVGAAVRIVQSTPVTSYTIPGGSLVAGTQYEFKVATRDAQGLPTADADLLFSTSLFQTFAAKPSAPTITAPAAGATVNATGTLTWSTPNQDAYQVQQLDGSGALVPGTDTGEVGGPEGATTRSLTLSFPTNNVPRTLQVRRKYGGLWSEWATVTVAVSWTAPADPTAVKASVPADGAIDITITNPAPSGGEPTVAYNDVYYAEPGGIEERRATLVAPNSTWRHWLPASDAVYTYRIVAVATNGTTSETVVS